MAITTNAELKTALANWLRPNATPSPDMLARIPEYIALFEAEANRILGNHEIDVIEPALAITSGYATIPDGLVRIQSLRLTTEPYNQIVSLPLDQIQKLNPTETGGPWYYARVGSQLVFYPPITATAQLIYSKGLTPLSADGDTNWLLQKHPGAYLYGSLRHADRRLIGARLQSWEAAFASEMAAIMAIQIGGDADVIQPQPSSSFVV